VTDKHALRINRTISSVGVETNIVIFIVVVLGVNGHVGYINLESSMSLFHYLVFPGFVERRALYDELSVAT